MNATKDHLSGEPGSAFTVKMARIGLRKMWATWPALYVNWIFAGLSFSKGGFSSTARLRMALRRSGPAYSPKARTQKCVSRACVFSKRRRMSRRRSSIRRSFRLSAHWQASTPLASSTGSGRLFVEHAAHKLPPRVLTPDSTLPFVAPARPAEPRSEFPATGELEKQRAQDDLARSLICPPVRKNRR